MMRSLGISSHGLPCSKQTAGNEVILAGWDDFLCVDITDIKLAGTGSNLKRSRHVFQIRLLIGCKCLKR